MALVGNKKDAELIWNELVMKRFLTKIQNTANPTVPLEKGLVNFY